MERQKIKMAVSQEHLTEIVRGEVKTPTDDRVYVLDALKVCFPYKPLIDWDAYLQGDYDLSKPNEPTSRIGALVICIMEDGAEEQHELHELMDEHSLDPLAAAMINAGVPDQVVTRPVNISAASVEFYIAKSIIRPE